ncbi:MAG: DUF86 domain-containing protein [Caldilineaceae bacterium]|nr:DUF86 domain-containing protein [Caldilineaceae bacterium]
MRPDRLYLTDIIDATDAIQRFLVDISDEDHFLVDELRQAAVLQKLIVIGEAAARLSAETKQRYASVEWQDIVGFRNIAVHAYFSVDWSIVWSTVTDDLPQLRQQIEAILADF